MLITCQTEITDEQIDNLLTGALEGGSNYWYMIENHFQGYAGEAWRKETGLIITDLEEGDNLDRERYALNRQSVKVGLELMAKGGTPQIRKAWNDFITENDDAETSDVFLQLCLFGEVIFG